MIKTIFLVVFVFTSALIHAQPKKFQYFDKEGRATSKEKCFSYVVQKKKYNTKDSILSFYCASGKPYTIIHVNDQGVWNGKTTSYYPNGHLKLTATFDKSTLMDTLTEYYSNGQRRIQRYFGDGRGSVDKIVNYWDSTGVQLVEGGNGFCRCKFSPADSALLHIGKVKNGMKDSLWVIVDRFGKQVQQEFFDNGHRKPIKSDVSPNVVSDDSLVIYTTVEQAARPIGGMDAFFEVIGRNIQYPKLARQNGVEGKVFVAFVVEQDGSISNIKTVQGIGYGCDEEAERLVRLLPPWQPGMQKGKPVRQKFVLPIGFRLDGIKKR